MLNTAFWRKWHRWIGFPAALFLCWAAATGFLVAFTEFFGEAEREREAMREIVSPVTLGAPTDSWSASIAQAFRTAAAQASPNAPVDRVTVQLKGTRPTVTIYTGKPGGGEDRKLVVDARTGALLSSESYADKPFLYRLHSGEAFGDGGLVFAMLWALSLVLLTVTGIIIYLRMRRRDATGLKRVFW